MTGSNVTRRGMIGGGVELAAIAASGDTVGAARAQSAQKTFVLVHGALVGGWYWRRVSDLLEKKGHKVFSPTLTGLGERSHLLNKDINLDTHITDIVNVFNGRILTTFAWSYIPMEAGWARALLSRSAIVFLR